MYLNFDLAAISTGNNYANSILNNSINLTRETARSWDRIWDVTINPNEPLWQACVSLGLFIAGMSVLYFGIKEARRIIYSPTWRRLIEMFLMPLGVFIFLTGNGYFLAGSIRILRDIAYFWLGRILLITLNGIQLGNSLQTIQNTNIANARARQIYADCLDKTGSLLQECLSDPEKLQQVNDALATLSQDTARTPLPGNLLETSQSLSSIQSHNSFNFADALTSLFANQFLGLIQGFLIALQWAFVNGLEAALFLTALFSAIALGLSVIPSAGPSFVKWISGFLSLFFMQLGYVLIVGVVATILNLTSQNGQSIGTVISDLAFLVFLSIIAPIMAVAIAKGGGDALFNGISRSGTALARLGGDLAMAAATGGTATGVRGVVKVAGSTARAAKSATHNFHNLLKKTK